MPQWSQLVGLLAAAGAAGYEYRPRHACGVCKELQAGLPCAAFGACSALGAVVSGERGCDEVCDVQGARTPAAPVRDGGLDFRVAKAFGTKPYDQVRISVISESATPPVAGFFDYSAQFVHRWTQFYLHTAVKSVSPGSETHFDLGTDVVVRLPVQGAGVAGVLIADPCVNSPTGKSWIGCQHGNEFQTITRTPALINAFVGGSDMDFWSISGDNFYDRTGEITQDVFSRISPQAKSKVLNSVPGNHDYWVLGAPEVATAADQCGNGFMQFYGQDTKAAQDALPGSQHPPFDFSINPGVLNASNSTPPLGCSKAALSNFIWYNQIGNVGLVGQSGAFSLEETQPFMAEACSWLAAQTGLDVVVLFGHWDVLGLGASPEMAMPMWYTEMAALPGCSEFNQRGMLKFIMGHTHCNDPHPHGKVGAGFRVAGFGMEGCGNYGIPVVDTTDSRVRFWYFDAAADAAYDQLLDCVNSKGWRQCTSLATLWLDQPIVPKPAAEEARKRVDIYM